MISTTGKLMTKSSLVKAATYNKMSIAYREGWY